jgi:hypothetical protein
MNSRRRPATDFQDSNHNHTREITKMARHYKGDPRWITARYAGKCSKTGEPFAAGARVFYYPNGGQVYAGAAAEAAEADFRNMAEQEAYFGGGESDPCGNW